MPVYDLRPWRAVWARSVDAQLLEKLRVKGDSMKVGSMLWLVRVPLALLAALALTACNPFAGSETFRYRLTVEVETPEGLKTGSSVIEVSVTQTGKNSLATPEARGIRFKQRGEAVAVDLPGGRTLFALLDRADGIAQAALNPPRYRHDVEYGYVKSIRDMKDIEAAGLVPRAAYPMLVTFTDIADPASVERVDPGDLAASFGPGVSLKRITVEVTDEPVTTGIEKRLGWLTKMEAYDYRRDGPFYKSYPTELLGLRSK